MRTSLVVQLTCAAVCLSAPQAWGHAGNVNPNVIHACVLPSGVIRIIAPDRNCLNNETPIHLAPASEPNVAQVTGAGEFACPTLGDFQPIPGFTVQLTTVGNPVMIMFTLFFHASPTGQIKMRPTIDG